VVSPVAAPAPAAIATSHGFNTVPATAMAPKAGAGRKMVALKLKVSRKIPR
jgi:hypothetical protein